LSHTNSIKEDKPDVRTLLFVTLIRGNKEIKDRFSSGNFIGEDEYQNIIIPLCDITIEETEKDMKIILKDVPKDKVKEFKYCKVCLRAAISVTTDPRMEHACDWSDLGCYRKVMKFLTPKITSVKTEDEKHQIIFTVEKDKERRTYEVDTTVPDRRLHDKRYKQ